MESDHQKRMREKLFFLVWVEYEKFLLKEELLLDEEILGPENLYSYACRAMSCKAEADEDIVLIG